MTVAVLTGQEVASVLGLSEAFVYEAVLADALPGRCRGGRARIWFDELLDSTYLAYRGVTTSEMLELKRLALYPAPPVRHQRLRPRSSPLAATPAGDYVRILFGDPCAYCGQPNGAIDHIEPVLHGGADGWENLTSACGSCNSSKGARPLLVFMRARATC